MPPRGGPCFHLSLKLPGMKRPRVLAKRVRLGDSRVLVTIPRDLLPELRERFEALTRRRGEHLVWTGDCHGGSWPRMSVAYRSYGAAHLAWLLDGRVLMLGQKLYRTCSERHCIVPAHRSPTAPAWSPRRRAAHDAQKRRLVKRALKASSQARRLAWRMGADDALVVGIPWAASAKETT